MVCGEWGDLFPKHVISGVIGNVRIGTEQACWEYLGRHVSGRPVISWKGMRVSVVRVLYQILYGPLDARQYIKHTCGHEWCVNPSHFAVCGESSEEPNGCVTGCM